MFDSVELSIKVPLTIDIRRFQRLGVVKRVTDIYAGWDKLTAPIPNVVLGRHYAIPTGRRNGITVVDIDDAYGSLDGIDMAPTVRTPNGSRHVYFEYDKRLQTSFYLRDHLKVLNDGSYVLAGDLYKVVQDKPLPRISDALLAVLLGYQKQVPTYDEKCYRVFSAATDNWFVVYDKFELLIQVLVNLPLTLQERMATLHKTCIDRFNYFDSRRARVEFETIEMNSRKRRFVLASLKKRIEAEHPERFALINDRWAGVKMKQGALVRMSDIKRVIPGATSTKLLAMNSSFVSVKAHACKHCKKLHMQGCCKCYNRKDRTTSVFVRNIKLS
jgi:hypothetical protein